LSVRKTALLNRDIYKNKRHLVHLVVLLDSQLPVESVPITTKIVLVAIKPKGPNQESKTWQRSAISEGGEPQFY